jgi:hypothetical protein
MRFETNVVVAKVSVLQPTQLWLATGVAPVKIRVDGNELTMSSVRFSTSEHTAQLSIPAGQHEIVLVLK